jgi:serine/threonine-protein kinase
MAQTQFRCRTCRESYPVQTEDLENTLSCKRCRITFQLQRIGDYVLLEELGRGAFSVVYKAYDLRNHRHVALKQLNESAVPEHEFGAWVKRAVAEARALGKIDYHPNVMPLFDSGYSGRAFYLVAPFIRGQQLAKMIPKTGMADPVQAVELAIVILRALEHVHGFGIYHRDIKPGNIMIGTNGDPMLIDFGLVAYQEGERSVRTQIGTVLGTPAYMPPEQALGDLDRVGPWSDQYSAGVVLYKMLTGNEPYPGKNFHAIIAAVGDYNTAPLPPRHFRPDLDLTLEQLVLKSIAKFPGDRFKNCAELADRLRAWLDSRPTRSFVSQSGEAVSSPAEPAPPKQQRNRPTPAASEAPVGPGPSHGRSNWWAVLVVVLVLLLGIGGVLAWRWVGGRPPPATPNFFDPTR